MPTSTQGHQTSYDETLLAAAPVATKKQIQGGYNPDLLKEKVNSTPPPRDARDVEAQLPSREVSITPPPTPFYRTKKGLIIIAVVAAVIIAAVVGGAVGGSKKHNPKALPNVLNYTTSASSGKSGIQTDGPASATSDSNVQPGGSPTSISAPGITGVPVATNSILATAASSSASTSAQSNIGPSHN